MPFALQTEMLSAAKQCLAPPYLQDEAHAIAHAFNKCALAFNSCEFSLLPETLQHGASRVQQLMSTNTSPELAPRPGEGLWVAKARTFTTAEKQELENVIKELVQGFEHLSSQPT